MQKWYPYILFLVLFISYSGTLIGQENGTFNQADSTTRIYFGKRIDSSNVFYNAGDFRSSLAMSIDILKEALESRDPYIIHLGYRNLAYDYLAIADTILASETFVKSQRYAQESKNDTAIALTHMDLANMYAINGKDYTQAFLYHLKSIEGFRKIKDSTRLMKAHFNTVLTAMEAKNYFLAFEQIKRVKELKDHFEHPSFAIGLENILGEYYYHQKDYKTAERYFLSAIEKSKELDLKVDLEIAYANYSDNLYAQKRYKEAYDIREKYEELYEENQNNISSAESGELAAKFQVSEYKKEMLAAEELNRLQLERVATKSRWNNYLIALFVTSLALSVLLFLAYRNRKKLIQELKSKNKEYLAAKEQTENMSKAKTNFFSTVSHELRTPLYGVIGLSTLLLEDKGLKKHTKDLSLLKFSADYLLTLINDVLQINKLDSNSLKNTEVSFNLEDLLTTLLNSFEYMRLQNNNKIHLNIDAELPLSLSGNSMRLSQILMNLISNACKFTEDGDIFISASSCSQNKDAVTTQFSIRDTGIGIAPDKHQSIFEEFSQLDSKNYQYQGTGLGLPIVKKLLEHFGSKIELQSVPDQGSTFSFKIDLKIVKESIEKSPAAVLDTTVLNNKRILIVEDNRINQVVTKKILEKDKVICALAENGNRAIELLKSESYDLVLMDINMPEKDGLQATREIRQFNQEIPIIALTAVEIEEVRYSIFEAGMNGIIVKPYDITQFKQVILENLQSNPPTNQLDAHLEAI